MKIIKTTPCSFRLMALLMALCLMALTANQALANDFENLFKQKYKKEMLPELRLSMTDRLKAKGMNDKQIEIKLNQTVSKAAECRFQTFTAYGKKFQKVAYRALKDSTTEDATFAVTDAMDAAVNKGAMSKKEKNQRMKKAMNVYNACVVKNDLLHR